MTIKEISDETAKWWSDFIREEVNKEKAVEFESKLSKYIEDTLKNNGNVVIECNYYPCDKLREIAKECGVEKALNNIPLKSFWMIAIIDGNITLTTKSGYGCHPFTTYDKLN